MSEQETYISIDIETDGPCPGVNSMLALGACVFRLDEQEGPPGLDRMYYSILEPLPEGEQNPDTMKWWQTQPQAWAALQENQEAPSEAAQSFVKWVDQWRVATAPGKLVAVAWPAAFDFGFVNYYCWRFAGVNPLGFACADIRSYAAGLLEVPSYYNLPEAQINAIAGPRDSTLRQHHALDDATEQAELFKALLVAAKQKVNEPRYSW